MPAHRAPTEGGAPPSGLEKVVKLLLRVKAKGDGKMLSEPVMTINLAVSVMGGALGVVRLAYMLSELNGAPGEALTGAEGLSRLVSHALEEIDG